MGTHVPGVQFIFYWPNLVFEFTLKDLHRDMICLVYFVRQ